MAYRAFGGPLCDSSRRADEPIALTELRLERAVCEPTSLACI